MSFTITLPKLRRSPDPAKRRRSHLRTFRSNKPFTSHDAVRLVFKVVLPMHRWVFALHVALHICIPYLDQGDRRSR